jgi:phosphopantetheine adenylyltransferase
MKVFAIYPGRFHPFHKGHKGVYDWLVTKFGADKVYITMTGVTDPVKSPFSFEERKKMAALTGVDADHIIQVSNNYNITPLAEKLPIDINKDVVFFAVSQKDMSDDPRFKSFTKKDGSPSYLQPTPKNSKDIKPAANHAYLLVAPTTSFTVLGKPANSATELRTDFMGMNLETKKKFVEDLFGKYDQSIFDVMNTKLRNQLKEMIKHVILEDYDSDIASLVKKRDTLDYEIEKVKLKKSLESMKVHVENMKTIEKNGGDIDAAKKQLDVMKKDIDNAKKRVSAANIKRSS